jgi:hypothetical protein
VITCARTSTVPRAVYLADLAWIGRNNILGTRHGSRLASPHRREVRFGIRPAAASTAAASTAAGFTATGNTTLEVSRTGTQSCQGACAARRGETAVSPLAARGLGAAFDVFGETGASVADEFSAARRASGGGDADAWCAAVAGAGTILSSPLGDDIGPDSVGTEEDDEWNEVVKMHVGEDWKCGSVVFAEFSAVCVQRCDRCQQLPLRLFSDTSR